MPWDDAGATGRRETAAERDDRNWSEVLQELRVLQTGTQILTGFLLTLAFQPVFEGLNDGQRAMYLLLVVLSALSAVLALAPVALHRVLFRGGAKRLIVGYGHVSLLAALGILSVLLVGVVAFVFDVVLDQRAAWIAGGALALCVLTVWLLVPAAIRHRRASGNGR